MDQRAPWTKYFMDIARVVATRATCPRKSVGAVITNNGTILSTGYNGSPRGVPHCTDVGCEMKDLGGRASCIRTVHAEANAIAQAARSGVNIFGSTLYTTASPCYDCMKLIINSGIHDVYCAELYGSRYGMSSDMAEFAKLAGINVIILDQEKPST